MSNALQRLIDLLPTASEFVGTITSLDHPNYKVLVVDGTGLVLCTSSTRFNVGDRVYISGNEITVAAMIHPSHVCTTLIPKFSNKKIPNGLLLLKISNRKKPATVGGSTIGKVSIPSIIAFFPGVVFTTLRAA